MTKNMVKVFIEEHKMQIALAAGAVTGIAIWAITKDKDSNYVAIDAPELTTGKWSALWRGVKGKNAGSITGCACNVNVTDLGKFGDALATIDGISPDEPIRVIFGLEKDYK